jgi:hypothetical protein
VRYELGFYIPEDGILHSDRRENLKSYGACSLCRISGRRRHEPQKPAVEPRQDTSFNRFVVPLVILCRVLETAYTSPLAVLCEVPEETPVVLKPILVTSQKPTATTVKQLFALRHLPEVPVCHRRP